MAISDKELMRRFQRRISRLETVGATDSDAYHNLQINLDVFWDNTNKKPTTKTRASLSKKLSVAERREMRQIMRKFLEEPMSNIPTIREHYQKLLEQQKHLVDRYEIKKKIKPKSISKQTSFIKHLDRMMRDKLLVDSLSSPIVNAVYNNQKATGISAKKYREAMEKMGVYIVDENDNLISFEINPEVKNLTQQEVINKIIEEVGGNE